MATKLHSFILIYLAATLVVGSLYDFPRACFQGHLGTCAAAQAHALIGGYLVDWSTVDAIRSIR